MTKKLTPWFPGGVKPVREGAYQTDGETGDQECFQHWSAAGWGYCAYTAKEARPVSEYGRSRHQHSKWRGLARKP